VLVDEVLSRRAAAFTLQWHLTHACDLHCRHCYDRSRVAVVRLDDAKSIVADLLAFCRARDVRPSLTLSGGNPFLHPEFFDIYAHVVENEIPVGILGNPVARALLEKLVTIRKPRFFQISLEGLEASNDSIRGPGTFGRGLAFLDLLRELEIPSTVMLTLTSANIDEVIPLGALLRGKVKNMTYTRLSQVGEGAALSLPSKERYGEMMVQYMAAARDNRTLTFKDNLFNIFRHELGMPLEGGCTGFGCGAAFNFLAVLPNGDAHACRKLPSPVGNLLREPLEVVYDSEAAQRYRRGCSACDGCAIRAKCGGCLAVAFGAGLDPFTERDPHCFMDD